MQYIINKIEGKQLLDKMLSTNDMCFNLSHSASLCTWSKARTSCLTVSILPYFPDNYIKHSVQKLCRRLVSDELVVFIGASEQIAQPYLGANLRYV